MPTSSVKISETTYTFPSSKNSSGAATSATSSGLADTAGTCRITPKCDAYFNYIRRQIPVQTKKEVAERHRRQTWQLPVAMGQQRPFSCSCRRCPVLPVDGWAGRCRPAVDDYCRSRIGQQRPPSRQRHHRNRHRQNASSTETNTRNVHLTLTLLYCKKWIDQNSFSWNWNVKWKHQRQDEESAKKIIALVCCQFKNKFHHSLGVVSNSSIHHVFV